MTASWDFNVASLTAIIALTIAIVVHIIAVTVYMVKTNGKATTALETAQRTDERVDVLDDRLRTVEREHVLGMALRQDFKEFQGSIGHKLDALRNERREDMNGLHSRLNEIMMLPNRPAE